ncbi:MAG TPA: hypothetical protein VIL35_11435 [Vicinamibacterales bacterium]
MLSIADELAGYLAHPYRAEAIGAGDMSWPLPDEPHVACWREYAAWGPAFEVLRGIFPQLRFPIREGISRESAYAAATRRGRLDAPDAFAPGLQLEAPAELTLSFSDGAGGALPILTASTRADFVTLVRAFTARNEPVDVPDSMGACFVKGLINWDRVARYRAAWEAATGKAGDEDAWREEMGRLAPQKALYQDRFVLLSRGPYSGVDAASVGLAEAEWLERSLVIRREHELAHNFTWRLFGIMRSHATDEIVADFVGIVRAFGTYRADVARCVLGLDGKASCRPGGRLANYRGDPPLSNAAFAEVARMTDRAIANLEALADRERASLTDPLALARLTLALTLLPLPELAADDMPRRLKV